MISAKREYVAGLQGLKAVAQSKRANEATLNEIKQIDTELAKAQEDMAKLPAQIAQLNTVDISGAKRQKPKLGNQSYVGRFCLYHQYGKASIFINDSKCFEIGAQTAAWSPMVRIKEGDFIVVKTTGEGYIRLSFVEKGGRQAIQLKAADLRDLTEYDIAKLTVAKVASEPTTASSIPDVHSNATTAWKKAVGDFPLTNAEWCIAKVGVNYQLGFVVSADLIQQLQSK
jgi:hypothetical protein